MAVSRVGQVKGLILKGWNEIPEVLATTAKAVFGMGLCFVSMGIYDSKNGHVKKYKMEYTVYRPDDPRAANIKKVCGLDS